MANFLPRLIDSRQQVFVISASQWFVDRTGLNIVPGNKDAQPCIPSTHYSDVRILEDSVSESQQMMSLTLPLEPTAGTSTTLHPNSSRHYQSNHQLVRAEVPPLGGYTSATIETPNGRLHTLILRSQKIQLTDTAGALSRIVTLVPKYIISNYCQWPIVVRQCRTQTNQVIKLNPGRTKPVIWTSKDRPLYLEFKPIPEDLGFYW